MSEETKTPTKIVPNEVILVGKLKNKDDVAPIIVVDADGKPLPEAQILKAVVDKYKFTRDTAPSAAALAANLPSGKFYHIEMGDPGGEYFDLPNGKKVKRSKKLSKLGWETIFAATRPVRFEEIKEELLSRNKDTSFPDRLGLVGGDPNTGRVRLTEFALMGFWDKFGLGFSHYIWQRNEKGELVQLMSSKKQDNGTFKPEPAFTNIGQHFVFEEDYDNLETLRNNIRAQVIRWKKVDAVDNTLGAATGEASPIIQAVIPGATPEKKADDEP